jgi:hypothetical protein
MTHPEKEAKRNNRQEADHKIQNKDEHRRSAAP